MPCSASGSPATRVRVHRVTGSDKLTPASHSLLSYSSPEECAPSWRGTQTQHTAYPPYPNQTSSFKPLAIWSEAASAALSSSASCALFRGRDSLRGPIRRRFATGWMAPTVEGVAVACIEGVQIEDKEHETKAVSKRTQVPSPILLLKHMCLSLCKGFSLANLVAPWPVGDCICLPVTAEGHDVSITVLPGRCVTALNSGWRVSTKASKTS